jgi:predicted NAD/FAD-binding protein
LKIQEKSIPKRLMIGVTINGIPIDMEVDTGAKASFIGRNIFEKYFSDQSIHPTGCLVWGSPLPMMGEFTATVCYRNQQAQ